MRIKYTSKKDGEFHNQLKEIDRLVEQLLTEAHETSKDELTLDDFTVYSTVVDVFSSYRSNEMKNELLREVIEYAEVHVMKKGRGRKPAKFKLIIKPNVGLM
ncbi:hypothetical protein KHA80_06345 [Anaerobacillus sp. HL2]|nr:hypothetical protein KHA80_06345 [Anaerobacillus sp. HL2]